MLRLHCYNQSYKPETSVVLLKTKYEVSTHTHDLGLVSQDVTTQFTFNQFEYIVCSTHLHIYRHHTSTFVKINNKRAYSAMQPIF